MSIRAEGGGQWSQSRALGTFLGVGTGQAGTSARVWDPWPGAGRSCSSGWAKAKPQLEAASPGQGSAPWHLGASLQVTTGKGPPVATLALSWPPALAAKAPGAPGDALNPHSRAHHHSPKQLLHKASVFIILWLEDSSAEMTVICSRQLGAYDWWGQFSRHRWLCGHACASKLTMPGAVCWI